MAKGKPGGGVQNRAIYSRISFLQQAAVALTSIPEPLLASGSDGASSANIPSVSSSSNHGPCIKNRSGDVPGAALDGMSRRLATDLRAVSLKTRIRLMPAVKQMICKFCDSVLIDGQSCTSTVENKSKGARKPWADVLVRRCHTCGRERRYPVSAARPRRKTDRRQDQDDSSHSQGQQRQQS